MSERTESEMLFEEFCAVNGVPCSEIPRAENPTPDYAIEVKGVRLTCEIKQINSNDADAEELTEAREKPAEIGAESDGASGRLLPNRVRQKLKDVSAQLKAASTAGTPTIVVIYDNTPFKSYVDHSDVSQAMFGEDSVEVRSRSDSPGSLQVSAPFHGRHRTFGPSCNTSVSAVAILDGAPQQPLSMRLYPNPYAAVHLDASIFASLPVTLKAFPDS